MSQIKPTLAILSMAAILGLAGCGDANKNAVFAPETGHPANWQTGHKTAGKGNLESCFECHGEELDGGIAKISCTSCHLGNAANIHPTQWGSYAYARHSSYVGVNGTTSCSNAACHGTGLTGITGSGPSCTSCHATKSGNSYLKHPNTWASIKDHGAYLTSSTGKLVGKTTGLSVSTTSCSTSKCHGTDLKGVFLSGTSCYSCHTEDSNGKFVKHPSSWNNVVIDHKSTVSTTSCSTNACHGTNLNGGTLSGAPSCYSCHINYSSVGEIKLHPANVTNWNINHAGYVVANGNKSCATSTCHAQNLDGIGAAGPSCTSCHIGTASSKHPTSWSSIKSHSSYIATNGVSSCNNLSCHGANGKGVTSSGPACSSCHSVDSNGNYVKHPSSWSRVVTDHKSTTSTTSCSTSVCHGTNLTGGTLSGAPSCYSCHINYAENSGAISKHPISVTSWRTAHYAYFGSHKPISSPTCTNGSCHLPGTRATDANCNQCHKI